MADSLASKKGEDREVQKKASSIPSILPSIQLDSFPLCDYQFPDIATTMRYLLITSPSSQ
ncbi:hypothetical protein Vi05172_g4961 [Venturia inaequalis]|nr:hypothetical protein Vi05172_g4961 [Venturia inaequalis]